jgi:hypothetical protein
MVACAERTAEFCLWVRRPDKMTNLPHEFTHDELPIELPKSGEPPCLSLYQPTHRHHPDNQQDPIRFRNLVKTLEQSLRQEYSNRELRPLLPPFNDLASDRDFWNHIQVLQACRSCWQDCPNTTVSLKKLVVIHFSCLTD